jgi:hypothetical protein
VAVELLVAVGIDRDKAQKMVNDAKNFKPEPLPEAPKQEPKPSNSEKNSMDMRKTTPNRLKIAKNKLTVVNSYRGVFDDAASRMVKREVQDITRAVKKDNFRQWVEEYFDKQPEVFKSIMTPAFVGLGESVQKCAAEECGGKVGMTPELRKCLDQHIDLTAKYHSDAAKGELLNILDGKRTMESEAMKLAIMETVSSWGDKIPPMITGWELTRTSGLMSKATYFYSGVPEIEWVAVVDVELCIDLDGISRTISANCRSDAFVPKNRALSIVCEHRKSLKDFTPSWNVYTPPLYNGCTCQIIPVIGGR